MVKTIAVIGANGRSGKAFIKAALAKDYVIKAGVHSKNTLEPHEGLVVVNIDSTNSGDIANLIKGVDVVVSLIGQGKNSPAHLQADTITILVSEMKKANISRLISLTGTGVRIDGDSPTVLDKLLNSLLKLVRPQVLSDGIQHADILKTSSLDWTIIRGLLLTNAAATSYTLKPNGPPKFLVPRAEIAQAILDVIEHNSYVHQLPIISSSD